MPGSTNNITTISQTTKNKQELCSAEALPSSTFDTDGTIRELFS